MVAIGIAMAAIAMVSTIIVAIAMVATVIVATGHGRDKEVEGGSVVCYAGAARPIT